MDKLSSLSEVEASLQRLMPKGLSEGARDDIEETIDELSREAIAVSFQDRCVSGGKLAVVLLVSGLVGIWVYWETRTHPAETFALLDPVPGGSAIEVLEQKTWIESGTELGLQTFDQDGELSRGWSYTGVEEERLFHGHSGYEVILQREFEAEFFAVSSL